ncbi:MAG: TIGR01777 family oxidoreductase [bacterium]|nr:TIGR01777 family oxidoreductase [bacterium]
MSPNVFIQRTRVDSAPTEVFAWHTRPGAFERLIPPWVKVTVLERTRGIQNGSRVQLRVPLGPWRFHWVLEHHGYVEGHQFRDMQIRGPFAIWVHTHRFMREENGSSLVEDRIEYKLPFGRLGRVLAEEAIYRKLARVFVYRHAVTEQDLTAHALYRSRGGAPQRILVSGSSGLIGSAVVPYLTAAGHRVTRLVRSRGGADAIEWDPAVGRIDRDSLEGFDAVVHLAGENINGFWTRNKRHRILDSRVRGTRLLAETLAGLTRPPRVIIGASAIGYYGNREGEVLSEDSPPGCGFMARVCREWEAATQPAAAAGIRVVNLRLGMVLTPAGGALGAMLPAFRLGLGGHFGDGRQTVSWIAIDDVLGIIEHALVCGKLVGPVNAVAPHTVSNADFTRALGRVLRRPTILRVPAPLLRALAGPMADEVLLTGARVKPTRLLDTGYHFRYERLMDALRHELGR